MLLYNILDQFLGAHPLIYSCAGVKNVTKDPLSPGETASFSLDSGSISLRPGEDLARTTATLSVSTKCLL